MFTKLLFAVFILGVAGLAYWVNFSDPLPGEPDYVWQPEPGRPLFEPERADPQRVLGDEVDNDAVGVSTLADAVVEDDPEDSDHFPDAPHIPEPSPEDIDELTRWYEERGRLSPYSEYRTYSLDVLQALADQGDIYALQLMARHAMRSNDRERARTYLTEAAARGSTHAIEHLARDQFVMMLRARRSEDLEQARAHAIETLAWYETAYRRGDLNARTRIDGMRRDLESIDLPEEAWAEAEALAENYYNDLAQQRTQLGYPVFDDAPHPVLQRYYELYRSSDE